jgi:sporulation protein YlmC with PRC-barrel domain
MKMKTLRYAMFAALALFFMAGTAFAAEGMGPSWGKTFSLGQVIGMTVRTPEGQELGRVDDVVVDAHGKTVFAVLSHGGFMGMGGKLVAVPFGAVSFDKTERHLVLDATREKLDAAPAFRMSALSNEKWAEEVYRYFGQQPFWTTGGDAIKEGMGVSPEPTKDEPMKKEEESNPYYDFYSY